VRAGTAPAFFSLRLAPRLPERLHGASLAPRRSAESPIRIRFRASVSATSRAPNPPVMQIFFPGENSASITRTRVRVASTSAPGAPRRRHGGANSVVEKRLCHADFAQHLRRRPDPAAARRRAARARATDRGGDARRVAGALAPSTLY